MRRLAVRILGFSYLSALLVAVASGAVEGCGSDNGGGSGSGSNETPDASPGEGGTVPGTDAAPDVGVIGEDATVDSGSTVGSVDGGLDATTADSSQPDTSAVPEEAGPD